MSFNNRSWRHWFIVVKMLDKRSSQDWNFPGMCKLRFFFKKNEKEEIFFSHPFFLDQLSSGFGGMRRRLKSARSCKSKCAKLIELSAAGRMREERGLLPYRVGTSPIFWARAELKLWVLCPKEPKPAQISLKPASSPSLLLIETWKFKLEPALSFSEN